MDTKTILAVCLAVVILGGIAFLLIRNRPR